jgi:hypothetical protein
MQPKPGNSVDKATHLPLTFHVDGERERETERERRGKCLEKETKKEEEERGKRWGEGEKFHISNKKHTFNGMTC